MQRWLSKSVEGGVRFVDAREYGGFRTPETAAPPLDARALGYRQMCAFMAFRWFAALSNYTHAMRVDDDVCINRLEGLEAMLRDARAVYGYGLKTVEQHLETLATWPPWLSSYVAERGLAPTHPPVPSDEIYFTNFFVTRVSWCEHPKLI